MLKRILVYISVIFLLESPALQAKTTSGINIPESLISGQTTLQLNGVGVRRKFFMEIYVGGLYLSELNDAPTKIINTDGPMAIRLHITSGLITSQKMEDAIREGFGKSTQNNVASISSKIEDFIAIFDEPVKESDTFNLVYTPATGLEVYKNNKFNMLIKGLRFKQALFGIWLGDEPADEDLKAGMLGS